MKQDEWHYSGGQNLEVMESAVNYNEFLAGLVYKYGRGHKSILDFGAGVGTLAKRVAEWSEVLILLEPDPNQHSHLERSGYTTLKSLGEVSDESLDFIYTVNVLEHVEADVDCLRLLARKLRPKGVLLVYVPAIQFLYSSMDLYVGHYRRYGRAELSQKLTLSGFRLDDLYYADSLGFAAALVFKYFGGESGMVDRRGLAIYDRYIFPVSRILDKVLSRLIGKNLIAVASKC